MKIRRHEGAVTQRTIAGPALYFIATQPEEKPRATIALVHGYADHGARYMHIRDAWAKEGIGSVSIDLRGHGRAEGQRGFCHRFEEYLDDVGELVRLMGTYAEGSPTFLMGHSFGGLVSTHSVMAARRHWRGLLLSSAYFGLGMDVPWIKVAVGKVASRVVPRLAMPTGLNGAMCTRHEGRAREYEEDPLGFKTATTRWFTEAQRAQEQALAQASQIELPVLAFFGTEDRIAKAEAAKAVFDGFRCADKTWKTYEGMRHETWNEIGWEQVAADVSSWVKAHSDG